MKMPNGIWTPSTAVMARRVEPGDSLDDFPTPPWATRALLEFVVGDPVALSFQTCLEPACGRGHMARTLQEYFRHVYASDIHSYGFGSLRDFLSTDDFLPANWDGDTPPIDWIITNPPFRLAEQFVHKAVTIAKKGVAFFERLVFAESISRYESIFRDNPPNVVAVFSERVPVVKGRLDRKAASATCYAWFVWSSFAKASEDRKLGLKIHAYPEFLWIPPCRKLLEKEGDYAN